MHPKSQLIIINAGKFGREVYVWAAQAIRAGAPWTLKGFLDDRRNILDRFRYEIPILSDVETYEPAPDDVFVCAIGEPKDKKKYCSIMQGKGARFVTLAHPTALVGHEVRIGDGSILGPYTQLSCDIVLGEHVVFGTQSNTAHDTRIGDYAQVCGSCEINGNAVIGEGAFIGSHATILPNANVGAWAYVGAGSVVLRRVARGSRVFGNPAVEFSR